MKTPPPHTCIDNAHAPCAACQADPKDYVEYLDHLEAMKKLPIELTALERDAVRYEKRRREWGDST